MGDVVVSTPKTPLRSAGALFAALAALAAATWLWLWVFRYAFAFFFIFASDPTPPAQTIAVVLWLLVQGIIDLAAVRIAAFSSPGISSIPRVTFAIGSLATIILFGLWIDSIFHLLS